MSNTLCRYRTCNDKAFQALENDKLFFSVPEAFNDPYDSLVYVNPVAIIRDISQDLTSNMDSFIEGLKREDIRKAAIADILYHGPNGDKNVRSFLEGMFDAAEEVTNKLRSNSRIICFSEVYDSMLMWSHYANYHKGFALVYEKTKLTNANVYSYDGEPITKRPLLVPVEYVEKQIDVTDDIDIYICNRVPRTLINPPLAEETLSQNKMRKILTQKYPYLFYILNLFS